MQLSYRIVILRNLKKRLKRDNFFLKQCNWKLPCLLGTPGLLDLLQGRAHPKQHILYRHVCGLEWSSSQN